MLFCCMLNTLLSNDLDTEDQNIYNMEGFLAFRDFEAYAYVSLFYLEKCLCITKYRNKSLDGALYPETGAEFVLQTNQMTKYCALVKKNLV